MAVLMHNCDLKGFVLGIRMVFKYRFYEKDIHIQSLSHILDEIGRHLSEMKFCGCIDSVPTTWRVL